MRFAGRRRRLLDVDVEQLVGRVIGGLERRNALHVPVEGRSRAQGKGGVLGEVRVDLAGEALGELLLGTVVHVAPYLLEPPVDGRAGLVGRRHGGGIPQEVRLIRGPGMPQELELNLLGSPHALQIAVHLTGETVQVARDQDQRRRGRKSGEPDRSA
jgi:hypothetical protein